MTNLKNKNNLNEFTKAYTDKNDTNYLVNKYNLSDEVQNTTDAFNEMTDEQINNAIQDTFITNNNGVFKYNNNDAIDYVNEYLLNCETKQQDMLVNVRGQMEDVEIIDVIGVIEEKGRIYVGLEVEYEEYCYLININFMNTCEYVYKDEMIEIQDVLSNLVSAQLKTDLGIQGTILDDVKEWTEELAEEYNNGQIGALNDLMQGGIQSGIVSHLIYNGDIMDFYDEHYTEIDEVLKRDNKQMFDTINGVWYVWEKVAYEYLTYLESK